MLYTLKAKRLKKSSFILGMFYSRCKILMKTYIVNGNFTKLSKLYQTVHLYCPVR